MATYEKANREVHALKDELLRKYADEEGSTYAQIRDEGVRIDILMAHGKVDKKTGRVTGDALTLHGVKALGITKVTSLKERANGFGDVLICLDGDWWKDANELEQRAVLDHELYHIIPVGETDDLHRPKIVMRDHDYQFGWFDKIAKRHRENSVERKMASKMMMVSGQLYWPGIAPEITVVSDVAEKAARAVRR